MFLLNRCTFVHNQLFVSVPCRGLTCFYLCRFSNLFRCSVSVPCRGLTCFYGSLKISSIITGIVSVPCRGLTCFYDDQTGEIVPCSPVSVPCRGLTCFYMIADAVVARLFSFPSPVGVLHVSIDLMQFTEDGFPVSVPCRGLTCFYMKHPTL